MKPKRLVYRPTRSRRLNEMLGLVLLGAAALLSLALITYNPADPSFNTVGGAAGLQHAHNWTGLLGAYTSDLLLQALGVAVFLLPLQLLRIGVSWMRSRSVGSGVTKFVGMMLWLAFAPAAIALLPFHLMWHGAVPIMGVEGRILADTMVHLVNLPGAAILCGLMVALSIYLVTTFTVTSSREWWAEHFGPFRRMRERYEARQEGRAERKLDPASNGGFKIRLKGVGSAKPAETTSMRDDAQVSSPNNSLLSGLFRMFRRRNSGVDDLSITQRASFGSDTGEAPSVWQTMPRTMVDEAPLSGLSTAAAAAAPFAAQLAAAAAPLTPAASGPVASDLPFAAPDAVREEDNWLDSPERKAFAPLLKPREADLPDLPPARLPEASSAALGPQLVPRGAAAPQPVSQSLPPLPSPMADLRDQNIAFARLP